MEATFGRTLEPTLEATFVPTFVPTLEAVIEPVLEPVLEPTPAAALVPTPDAMMALAAGPAEPTIRDMTLGDLLAWAAMTVPDRTALIGASANPGSRPKWSYAELYSQSLCVARALRQRYVPGERIAVWAVNVPEWVLLEFGAAMAGLVLVPLNPRLTASEVEYALKQSAVVAVFVCASHHGQPVLAAVQTMAPRCRHLREVVRLDRWAAFMASGSDASIALPPVQSDDVVMIQYTSGTTGPAKGARLHHRGLVNSAAHAAERMGADDGGVWLGSLPLFHTSGCALTLLGAIAKRATLVLMESFEPGLAIELISTYRAQVWLDAPGVVKALLDHPDRRRSELSSLRAVCLGGAAVPAPLVAACEETLGVTVSIAFGQTECSAACLMTHPADARVDKCATVGAALPGVQVCITDVGSGQTVALGEIGEVCTRGYHVMKGYFNMAAASADAVDKAGWLHTGDLGAMDARGYVTLHGRLNDVISPDGDAVRAHELEELLFRHPKVNQAAVLGLPDDKGGDVVAAFIRPVADETLSKTELQAYLRRHLSLHKTPRYWFVVNSFPMTGSGKIQKFKLREHFVQGLLVAL